MIKKEKYIGLKLDTDTAADKRERDSLFANYGFEVTNNEGLLSLSKLKGPTDVTEAEVVSLLGWIEVLGKLYIFDRDPMSHRTLIKSIAPGAGAFTLVATLSVIYPAGSILDIVTNKENTNIVKLYWANPSNQLCSINLMNIASPSTIYNPEIITPYELIAPEASIIAGGNLIAGKVQYGYTLFGLHGTETKISPLSELLSVSLNMEGGESAEVMRLSAKVILNPTATGKYTHMRVFSIHYQELNQLPKITLIYEAEISSVTIIDDGNLFIAEYGIEQFLNLGGTLIKPKTIIAKNNRLFAANYDSSSFDVPFADDTDTRCYAFEENSEEFCVKNKAGTLSCYTLDHANSVPETHDAIRPDLNFNYTYNSSIVGVEGTNFKITFNSTPPTNNYGKLSLKQGETYRIGLVWYDDYMRITPVKWMADIVVPYFTGKPQTVYITVTFKGNAASLYSTYGIKGYRLARVQRLPKDRTISSPGIVMATVNYRGVEGMDDFGDGVYPYYILKRMLNDVNAPGAVYFSYATGDWPVSASGEHQLIPVMNDDKPVMYSSDTIFEEGKLEIYTHARVRQYYTGNIASKSKTLRKRYFDGNLTWEDSVPGIVFENGSPGPRVIYDSTHISIAEELGHFYSFDTIHEAAESGRLIVLQDIKGLERNSKVSIATASSTKVVHSSFPYPAEVDIEASNATSLMQNDFERCYALGFVSGWNKVGGTTGDKFSTFAAPAVIAASDQGIAIIELTRTLGNQYNGNTYAQRQTNQYMLLGDAVPMSASHDAYIGDTYIGPLIINRADGLDRRAPGNWNVYDYIMLDRLEHNVDVNSRYDAMYDWFSGTYPEFISTYRLKDNRLLLTAYNQEETLIKVSAKPITFDSVTEFKASIISSSVKYPNEVIDSWTEFLPNDIMNLQGMYGPINKLYNFKNEVIAFQTTGVVSIAIQPRVQIQTDDSIGVELGTGQVLYDYKYLITKSGTIAMRSVVDDGNSLFYYDDLTNTINALTGEELTIIMKIGNLMDVEKPSNATKVQGVYINSRREFMFSLQGVVLVYSPGLKGFQRTDKGVLTDTQVVLLGKAYFIGINGRLVKRYSNSDYMEDTKLSYIFAPDPTAEKVFHNLEFRYKGNFNVNNVVSLMLNEGVSANDASPVIANKFGIGRYHLPRLDGTKERLRTTSIKVELNFDAGEEELRIHDMVIMYNTKG